MKSLKIIGLALFAGLIAFSCNTNETGKNVHKGGKLDMEALLTKQMIRDEFNLAASVPLEPNFGRSDNYISYDFKANVTGAGDKNYSVALNFGNGKPLSSSTLDARWKSQNSGVYKDQDMEEIPGVGRKASWSTLTGGQLRVVSDGYMFYITIVFGEKEVKKEKAIALAKQVVQKL